MKFLAVCHTVVPERKDNGEYVYQASSPGDCYVYIWYTVLYSIIILSSAEYNYTNAVVLYRTQYYFIQ